MSLRRRMLRDIARITGRRRLNTAKVIAHWDAAAPPSNPNDESTFNPPVPTERAYYPLVHFVAPARSGVRIFAEIQVGDVILDFPADVELPPKGAWFEIDAEGYAGQRYVQKDAGDELARYWDVICEGQPIYRTLLLTLGP